MSARFIRSLLIFIHLLAAGCAPRANADAFYAEAAKEDPRTRPWVIGVADVVRVSVWKDPNLSTDATVGPDGNITLPLVGEIRAAGSTVATLQQQVATRLQEFAKDAVVTVSVAEVNSYHFTVAGNVEHPGMFTPRYFVKVSEALALAGGPTRYADTDDVVIVRNANGRSLRVPIDYDAILSGKAPEQDIVVLAGDSLRVP